jgi:hypothetical protein
MSVRFRFYAVLCGWVLFSVGQAALASPSYGWLAFPVILVVAVLSMSQRCPVCRKSVGHNYGIWMPYAPRICTRCGHDLSKRGITRRRASLGRYSRQPANDADVDRYREDRGRPIDAKADCNQRPPSRLPR